ncbi:MAG: class I SAM-dependent methyltransferase [Anaerolineae bacterium]|nr:class I SAM-dependent methyltransferase [Anaerolineae bacterium]
MSVTKLYREQQIQEDDYRFPYHYIPSLDKESFTQTRYWNWGFRYLGGLRVVQDQLSALSYNTLCDLGCGDGRFLRELAKQQPSARLMGIDYSERAITIARVLNPTLDYRQVNILDESFDECFDVITSIEVLEHIPPEEVEKFLRVTVDHLNAHGTLILTVPHINVPVQAKHFQHFSSESLHRLMAPLLRNIRFVPFDGQSRLLRVLFRLIGGQGEHFIVTNRFINRWFFAYYIKYHLYVDEARCTRIAVVATKP